MNAVLSIDWEIIQVKFMYTSKKNIRNVRRLWGSRTTKSEEIR